MDTSLPYAAIDIQEKSSIPFCITLDGFLHIISPYVRIEEQSTFADLFYSLVTRNFSPADEVISLDDLLMFTDHHHSIRHSDPEYLKRIVRHVQNTIDQNLPQEERQKHIAYELQKALSNPDLKIDDRRDKKIKQQEKEIGLLKERMSENERKLNLEKIEIESKHATEIAGLKNDMHYLRSDLNDFSKKKVEDDIKHQRTNKVNRITIEVLASLVLLGIVFLLPNYLHITHYIIFKYGVLVCVILFLITEVISEKFQSKMLFVFTGLGVIISFLAWIWK